MRYLPLCITILAFVLGKELGAQAGAGKVAKFDRLEVGELRIRETAKGTVLIRDGEIRLGGKNFHTYITATGVGILHENDATAWISNDKNGKPQLSVTDPETGALTTITPAKLRTRSVDAVNVALSGNLRFGPKRYGEGRTEMLKIDDKGITVRSILETDQLPRAQKIETRLRASGVTTSGAGNDSGK